MPQSLSRVLVHLVFSTKNREPWITDSLRPELFAYLATVGRDTGCEVYRVGGVSDHVHLAIQLSRTTTIADLVKKLKQTSSVWIKEHGSNHSGFSWQAGYGAFSFAPEKLQAVCDYLDGQAEHHRKVSFQDEYRKLLGRYGVEFDERYVWD